MGADKANATVSRIPQSACCFSRMSVAEGINTFGKLGILSHIPLTNGLFSPISDARLCVSCVFGANPHVQVVE